MNAVSDTVETEGVTVESVRQDFPLLHREIHGKPLVYLDNAATAQKPNTVIDVVERYYREENANIHRGVHYLSETATEAYEQARLRLQALIHAPSPEEVLFVRGATEGINLVASSFGERFVKSGDEIIISEMEHHSNIVPWQLLCERKGAVLKVIPVNDHGELKLDEYEKLLSPKTKLVAVTHTSNALGTNNPVEAMVEQAHAVGAKVLLDGAQAIPHHNVDVQALGCDFYTFSGHKLFGPTGVGVLYGRAELLNAMPPYHGGGDMIERVTFEKTTFNVLPHKFEAGTPNIVGGIALGEAAEYVRRLGYDWIAKQENALLEYATQSLENIDGLRLIGTAKDKAAVCSFVMDSAHPNDIGFILDREGVAIRTGHHCTQPLMDRFEVPATARASFAFYNTLSEVDVLCEGLRKVTRMFA